MFIISTENCRLRFRTHFWLPHTVLPHSIRNEFWPNRLKTIRSQLCMSYELESVASHLFVCSEKCSAIVEQWAESMCVWQKSSPPQPAALLSFIVDTAVLCHGHPVEPKGESTNIAMSMPQHNEWCSTYRRLQSTNAIPAACVLLPHHIADTTMALRACALLCMMYAECWCVWVCVVCWCGARGERPWSQHSSRHSANSSAHIHYDSQAFTLRLVCCRPVYNREAFSPFVITVVAYHCVIYHRGSNFVFFFIHHKGQSSFVYCCWAF